MSSALRIAVAQVHPPTADVAGALARLRWLLAAVRAAGAADLLVLPECWLQAYHLRPELARRLAVPLGGADEDAGGDDVGAIAVIRALAKEFAVAVALGLAERCACGCGAVYNTLALVGADGALVGAYRKTHLWGDAERAAFCPGPSAAAAAASPEARARCRAPPQPAAFAPLRLPGFPRVPIGLLVCFDLEFPEPARILALAGARLVLASVAMGEREAFASRVFARARACENHIGIVYANFPSSEPPAPAEPALAGLVCAPAPRYSGGSCVVGPAGSVLHALPAYARPGEGGRNATQPGASSERLDSAATAAVRAALLAGGAGGDAAAPSSLGFDEHVFVVRFDPDEAEFAADAARNPYLEQRRRDLYGLDRRD